MPNIVKIGIIVVAGVFLLVILSLFGLLPGKKPPAPPEVRITFWGFQDDESVWEETFKAFATAYPHISIVYSKINENVYEETLLNRLAAGTGPDIFYLPNALLRKHEDKIFGLAPGSAEFSARDFRATFVDGVVPDLVKPDGTIIGLPLFVDTPALFYNKDLFNAVGIAQPPQTWEEVVEIARRFTELNRAGEIVKSGVALGSARNIERAFEIVSSLMLQYGSPIVAHDVQNPALGGGTIKALEFYTSFGDSRSSNFSWTSRLKNAFEAFAEGKTPMVFGLSRDLARIVGKNPHLNLGIAPFPQLKGAATPVVYGSYLVPVVSKLSQSPGVAWQFLFFATSRNGAASYLVASKRPAARRDLLVGRAPTAELDVFHKQSLIAKTWKLPDERVTRVLFENAVESVVSGSSKPASAVSQLGIQLQLLSL